MKVLVIKPTTFCNAEGVAKLKDIKPSENGVVLVPSYCDYEFGEIDEVKVNGFADEYMKGIADFMEFEKFFYNGNSFIVFDDVKNEDGSLSIEGIMRKLSMDEIMKRIENYKNYGTK